MKTRDFERIMPENMTRVEQRSASCPSVKSWPDNAFSEWVSSHRTQVRGLVCKTEKYSDAPFCKRGRRSS